MGAKGCFIARDSDTKLIPAQALELLDSRAACDSFNAGYVTAKVSGSSSREGENAAHKLVSAVIQHRGAIIPALAMP